MFIRGQFFVTVVTVDALLGLNDITGTLKADFSRNS
jgi:hypothetical protein